MCVKPFARDIIFAVVLATSGAVARPALASPPAAPVGVPVHPANAPDGEADAESTAALDPRRFELAGFPVLGGNSDIGVQFGGAATYTRFYDAARQRLLGTSTSCCPRA